MKKTILIVILISVAIALSGCISPEISGSVLGGVLYGYEEYMEGIYEFNISNNLYYFNGRKVTHVGEYDGRNVLDRVYSANGTIYIDYAVEQPEPEQQLPQSDPDKSPQEVWKEIEEYYEGVYG
jgi:hypothetical protein